MTPYVEITRTFYTGVADGGHLMDEHTRTSKVDCEPDTFDREEGLTRVDLAVKAIEGMYPQEASREPFTPGAWYSRSDEPDQLSPEGTETEETSAHLHGFTPDEEREIFRKLRASGALPHGTEQH